MQLLISAIVTLALGAGAFFGLGQHSNSLVAGAHSQVEENAETQVSVSPIPTATPIGTVLPSASPTPSASPSVSPTPTPTPSNQGLHLGITRGNHLGEDEDELHENEEAEEHENENSEATPTPTASPVGLQTGTSIQTGGTVGIHVAEE